MKLDRLIEGMCDLIAIAALGSGLIAFCVLVGYIVYYLCTAN